MKCPKCGSENVLVEKCLDGFSTCQDCGYRWQHGRTQPEPTTAEKLYWLVESGWFYSYYAKDQHRYAKYKLCEHLILLLHPDIDFNCAEENDFIKCTGNTLDEAIEKAYAWAKEQEERNERENLY